MLDICSSFVAKWATDPAGGDDHAVVDNDDPCSIRDPGQMIEYSKPLHAYDLNLVKERDGRRGYSGGRRIACGEGPACVHR